MCVWGGENVFWRGGKEFTETGVKLWRREPRSYIIRIGSIRAISVKARRERRSQREPKATKAAEDDKGKGVAEEEFEDAA